MQHGCGTAYYDVQNKTEVLLVCLCALPDGIPVQKKVTVHLWNHRNVLCVGGCVWVWVCVCVYVCVVLRHPLPWTGGPC